MGKTNEGNEKIETNKIIENMDDKKNIEENKELTQNSNDENIDDKSLLFLLFYYRK